MVGKALQQLCNLYQLNNSPILVSIVSQMYKELGEESKLIFADYLPKIVLDLNQKQVICLLCNDISASTTKNLWTKIFEILPSFDSEYLMFDDFLFIFDLLSSSFVLEAREEVYFKFMLHICKTAIEFEIVWAKLKLHTKDRFPSRCLMCVLTKKIVQNPSFISPRVANEPHCMNSLANLILIGLNKIGSHKPACVDFAMEHLEYLFGIFKDCIELLPSSFAQNLLRFSEKSHNAILFEALYCSSTDRIQIVRILNLFC